MRIVLFALALSLCLLAQAPTGEITGTVTDPSGAVLSGASLTLTHPATSITSETLPTFRLKSRRRRAGSRD